MQKTIYKKDSTGKIRYLTIGNEGGFVIQESGVIGTPNPVINRSACEAKNVGRSNSTTPEEQAELEAQSKLTEKMRLGYFDTQDEAMEKGGADFLLPMLAKDFKKESKKVKFPCWVQPKLDGMRGLASEDFGFMSRTGKAIDTLGHIVLGGFDDNILDGELYAHGISFQENMKLIKKYRPEQTEQVKYHVYDLISDLPFPQRYLKLHALVQGMDHIHIVHTARVDNLEQLNEYHQQFLAEGYEGTMVRHSDEGYQVNKRSSQLLKYKDFLDEAYECVDIIPSEARPEQGVVVCKMTTKAGTEETFNCGMKFSHLQREQLLKNKGEYIGEMAEIRFFEFTDAGIPRFPVCVGFRLDKK